MDLPLFKKFVLPGIAGLLILILFFSWLLLSDIVEDTPEGHTLKIAMGTSFSAVVSQMLEQGIIRNDFKLRLSARLLGSRSRIKAGKYRIQPGASSYEVLSQLVDGAVIGEVITIPEGLQARQIASILQARLEIDSTEFMTIVHDSARAYRLAGMHDLEGVLFPDTYSLNWGMNAEHVIKIMVGQFNRMFDDSLRRRLTALNLTLRECLTMASIVEGESILDSERPIISAVYHNRLERGMRLQADPTIQYIVEDGPRRLLNRDLKIDSPYNTYMYSGLPPGPINNPGLASIRASLYPADVEYLYFVANGDGSHTFTRTLKEHLRAKARFDEHRRKVRQIKKNRESNGETSSQ